MRTSLPTLALLALLAAPAGAQAIDRDFPFSTGPAPARVVDFDVAYTPTIKAFFPAEVGAAEQERLLGYLREHMEILPAPHRGFLREVVFDPGSYPGNRRAGARYKIADLRATAIAMRHSIVFYRNPPTPTWTVTRGTVLHEFGHVVANAKFGSPAPPAAWAAAARSDGAFFTAYSRDAFYGSGTLVEDFADAYANFVGCRRFGGEELTAFQTTYPARYRLLENYAY